MSGKRHKTVTKFDGQGADYLECSVCGFRSWTRLTDSDVCYGKWFIFEWIKQVFKHRGFRHKCE